MTIEQEVIIGAAPSAVYEVLTSSARFTAMCGGAEANISDAVGGEVSLFGGAVQARNVELVPGTRVVQTWRSADWPEGVHSIVRFELAKDGAGTQVSLSQSGHPADAAEHLNGGWSKMYWGPMNALFAQS